MFFGSITGEPHQRGRGEVRDVADDGNELIVAFRGQRDHLGTERCHHRRQPGEHRVVAVGTRRQDPHGPFEQVALCAVEPVEFRSGHRMPADEPGVGSSGADRCLDTADVGDGSGGLGECSLDLVDRGQHRNGHERDLGVGIEAESRR